MADRKTRLELTWIGKENRPRLEPRILLEDPELSYSAKHRGGGYDLYGNMIIQGDNLLALKALQGTHFGQVKCIYIDPPFNTKNAISDYYDDGQEHSIWLSLMRTRIELLRDLLSLDGAIFVHLDDNEIDYLKVLMDEIFGRSNFVGRITIDARSPSAFSTVNPGVFKASEYLLWYARDKSNFVEHEVRVPRAPDPAYNQWIENPDESHTKWRFSTLRDAFEASLKGDSSNRPRGRSSEDKLWSAFIVANAKHIFRLTAISDTGAGRATLEGKAKSLDKPNSVIRVDRGEEMEPQFLLRGQQIAFYEKNIAMIDGERTASRLLTNIWTDIAWEGIAAEGGVTFKKGKKPEKLVKRCIELCTNPGDIVLDSFAGSGTTAAVAHKMRRRWITVELGEHAESLCVPRLRAVVSGADQSGVSSSVKWTGGGGFRFYRIAPSLLERDKWGNWIINRSYNKEMLAEAVCKLNGFTYAPSKTLFWMHGQSTERDFLYVTTQTLSFDQLRVISEEVGPEHSLLICCGAWVGSLSALTNLTLAKIPQSVLSRCEWGKDDYSLNIANLTGQNVDPSQLPLGPKDTKTRATKSEATLPLFTQRGDE